MEKGGKGKVGTYLQSLWLEEAHTINLHSLARLSPLATAPLQRHDNAETYPVHQYFEVTTIYACMLKGDFYITKSKTQMQ